MFFFAHAYPVFPVLFVEKTIFSPLNASGTVVENHLIIYSRDYYWALYFI